MAKRVLLPGWPGYTSEQFSSTTTGVDTIDASQCAQIAVQIHKVSGTPTGNIQLVESYGAGSANLGSAISVATDGTITKFPITNGPFGQLSLSSTVTGGVVTVTIVGFPLTTRF